MANACIQARSKILASVIQACRERTDREFILIDGCLTRATCPVDTNAKLLLVSVSLADVESEPAVPS